MIGGTDASALFMMFVGPFLRWFPTGLSSVRMVEGRSRLAQSTLTSQ